VLLQAIAAYQAGVPMIFSAAFVRACGRVLQGAENDPAFAAEALSLPGATTLAEHLSVIDPEAIHVARHGLRQTLARALRGAFDDAYRNSEVPAPYSPEPTAAGRRALRNVALSYLMELDDPEIRHRCVRHFTTADNMTDAIAALTALANSPGDERVHALAMFYAKWESEPLVIDKWFTVQATSRLPDTLGAVRALCRHEAFELTNPNKIRALIGAFCQANHAAFHAGDGGGYWFAAEHVIALDPINPQIAARLARAFDRWRKFDAGRQAHARAALEQIRDSSGLSKDTTEVVSRLLN
ncbi:MAG: aminopeptidase N C-terminal domain-containing protein, partial [Gammaproteobacteria bacterium]